MDFVHGCLFDQGRLLRCDSSLSLLGVSGSLVCMPCVRSLALQALCLALNHGRGL